MLGHGGLAALHGTGGDTALLELRGTSLESAPVGLAVGAGLDRVAAFGFLVARVGGHEGGEAEDDCLREKHLVWSDASRLGSRKLCSNDWTTGSLGSS